MSSWTKDVKQLSELAADEPQAAYSAYVVGMSKRWRLLQRTVGGISNLFAPLEEVISNELLPALCGKYLSETERTMVSLPVCYGGLGIENPILTADREYATSKKVCAPLVNSILAQDADILSIDKSIVKKAKSDCRKEKEAKYNDDVSQIENILNDAEKRFFLSAREKGSSAWLTSPPIKALGYALNKREFVDSICLRYGWRIEGTPNKCACGAKNDADHMLICKCGGFAIMRHNNVRDAKAKFLSDIAKNDNRASSNTSAK